MGYRESTEMAPWEDWEDLVSDSITSLSGHGLLRARPAPGGAPGRAASKLPPGSAALALCLQGAPSLRDALRFYGLKASLGFNRKHLFREKNVFCEQHPLLLLEYSETTGIWCLPVSLGVLKMVSPCSPALHSEFTKKCRFAIKDVLTCLMMAQ